MVCFCLQFFSGGAEAASWLTWEANSGLLPEQISIPWTATDTSATPVVLSGEYLTLSTTSPAEYQFYDQAGDSLDMASGFSIEANLRYLSGTSNHPDRTGAVIGFTVAPNIGNALFISADQVFFNTDNLQAGPSAFVDTDEAFHTYRINVSAAGELALYYDGGANPILTGQTFYSEAFNGVENRILWGDGTFLAAASSQWASFGHNAIAVPIPAAVWLFGPALLGLLGFSVKRSNR